MITDSLRAITLATALAAAVAGAAPTASAAVFDGPWSVLIVTRRGACDPSLRIGVMIRGGRVSYLGGGAVAVSGGVSKSGRVTVSLSSGGQFAAGSGRLSNGRGGGTWRGQGSKGVCSGTWSAAQG
jgi:hypothetical protein